MPETDYADAPDVVELDGDALTDVTGATDETHAVGDYAGNGDDTWEHDDEQAAQAAQGAGDAR